MLLPLLVLALSGCAQKQIDLEAERAALMDADKAWAATLAEKSVDGFTSYFTADAIVMPPHLPILVGIDAVRAWATESMALPGFSVTWTVTSADVAASGDMGYTLGTFVFQATMPDGSTITDPGKYTTIWKKQADGSWKVAVDTFNSDSSFMPSAPAAGDTTGVGQ
ncbi:MAG TPA: DUF4440 domain-containing protein [Candidatus Krumholzibacteria bacterium]|nr:DUF4440 domain-containing protein [Candidatus Krumholzibacteria bacterium]